MPLRKPTQIAYMTEQSLTQKEQIRSYQKRHSFQAKAQPFNELTAELIALCPRGKILFPNPLMCKTHEQSYHHRFPLVCLSFEAQ